MNPIIEKAFSMMVTTIVFGLSTTITLSQYSYNQYPEATRAVMALAGIYMTYRITLRIIKSWIGLIRFFIRSFVYIVVVIILLAVYVRGTRLFNQDLPLLYNLASSYKGENIVEYGRSGVQRFMVETFLSNLKDQTQAATKKSAKSAKSAKKEKKANKKKAEKAGINFQENAKRAFQEYGIPIDEDYLEQMNEQYEKYKETNDLNDFIHNLQEGLNGLV